MLALGHHQTDLHSPCCASRRLSRRYPGFLPRWLILQTQSRPQPWPLRPAQISKIPRRKSLGDDNRLSHHRKEIGSPPQAPRHPRNVAKSPNRICFAAIASTLPSALLRLYAVLAVAPNKMKTKSPIRGPEESAKLRRGRRCTSAIVGKYVLNHAYYFLGTSRLPILLGRAKSKTNSKNSCMMWRANHMALSSSAHAIYRFCPASM